MQAQIEENAKQQARFQTHHTEALQRELESLKARTAELESLKKDVSERENRLHAPTRSYQEKTLELEKQKSHIALDAHKEETSKRDNELRSYIKDMIELSKSQQKELSEL